MPTLPVPSPPFVFPPAIPTSPRLDHLDATRAFALVLGVVFHAALSFSPYFMGWAVQDVSTGPRVPDFMLVSHSFRMELFFVLAGFFSQGMLQRQGLGAFLRSRAIRIGGPFVAGWFLLRPLIMSGWIMGGASMRGEYDFWAGIRAGFATLKTLPTDLFTGSHLWFLYYLLLITTLALLLRWVFRTADRCFAGGQMRARADGATNWLARSGWALPLLVLPTAVALGGMRHWGMDTPDRSLWPHLPVLAVYGGFFGLGWLFGRQPGAIASFGRLTLARALLAAGSIVLTLKLGGIQADPGHPYYTAARVGFTLGYAVLMWTLVALTLGIFRRFYSQPRPAIRYLADSSYWMYLIHLPVVVWLQVAVAEVPLHWSLKLAFVSAATIGLALLTYDLFVRSTILGEILNGRRHPRALFFFRATAKAA
ncbi:MAG TPA: acyltransferase family protein [Lacunisphaera sp.]|nr:acyltransferase family protein [Lacunisphaera sp.]